MEIPSRRRTGRTRPQAPRRTPLPTRPPPAEADARLALPAEGLDDGVVRLRPPRESDAHAIARGCDDPDVARWTRVPSPYTLEDARAWIAFCALQRDQGRELPLVIVRSAEDSPVGGTALRLRTDPEPHGEIGYWVAAQARRQGLGARAVGLLARYGLERLGLGWIEIAVSPRNEASLALARRAGFEPYGAELREFRGRMEEFTLFRMGAP